MQLFAFGINHQTAPLDIREQVAFPAERLEPALHDLAAHKMVKEAAILSTCNRTEIYCNTEEPYQYCLSSRLPAHGQSCDFSIL